MNQEFVTVYDPNGNPEVLDYNQIEPFRSFEQPMIKQSEEPQQASSVAPVNVVVITGDKSGNVNGEPSVENTPVVGTSTQEKETQPKITTTNEPISFMKPLINYMTGSKTEESANQPNNDGGFVVKKVE